MKTKIGIGVVVLLIIFVISIMGKQTSDDGIVTTVVQRGDVTNTVSMSGFIEAKNTANLAFPVVGTVTDVFVKEGDIVRKGELLATLGASKLIAQRASVVGVLQKAQAAREELISGPTPEARLVTQTSVAAAEDSLLQITKIEDEKVENARNTLLSTGLEARSKNPEESAPSPTVTGTYTCDTEGAYNLSVYTSGTLSGYSYILKGLEGGTGVVTYDQPATLGDCGLSLQFTGGASYANSEWSVEIPNTKGSAYLTYKHAYNLALKEREKNIQAAADTLSLAQKTQASANATPRSTSLRQSDASIYSARAQIMQIDAQIRDLSIAAPFDGLITSVDIVPGETVTSTPVLTLLAQDAFELKARVPEIDIKKIEEGQKATVSFDADPDTPLAGTVSFVSPLATIIDGVAYFQTTILLDEIPSWIRSGLNADIDIIVDQYTDVLKIPKRYLIKGADGQYTVLRIQPDGPTHTPIEVTTITNDGFAAITGMQEGDSIIAP